MKIFFRNALLRWFAPKHVDFLEQFMRFGISGLTASASALMVVFVMTSVLHVWYLISSAAGFCVAFIITFLLQKFWTFRERMLNRMPIQTIQSILVAACNFGMNIAIMWLLVEQLHLPYIIAQCAVYILLGIVDFGIYKFFIFRIQNE